MTPQELQDNVDSILHALLAGRWYALGDVPREATRDEDVSAVLAAVEDAVASEDGLVAKALRKIVFWCEVDGDVVLRALVVEFLRGDQSRDRQLAWELKDSLEAVEDEDDEVDEDEDEEDDDDEDEDEDEDE